MHLPSFKLPQPKLLGGIAIGILVGVIGVGAVSATPAPTVTPAAATSSVRSVLGVEPDALIKAFRKDFRIEVNATGKNGTHDILYTRGVLGLGTAQLTVTLPDNSAQVFTTDAGTAVRDEGKVIALSDLQSGERAMVFGVKNADGTFTAKLIRCISEPAPAPNTAPTTTP
jgi:hypothetical protein